MKLELIGLLPECSYGDPHVHTYWEIVLFVRGQGVHTVGEIAMPFHPGMIVCQPPGMPHRTAADGTYQEMYLVVSDFTPPAGVEVPVYNDVDQQFLTLAQLTYRIFYQKGANYSKILDSLTDAISQILVGWALSQASGAAMPKSSYINETINEMIANIANPSYDIAKVIASSGYCDDHFRRQFRKETGLTPTEYMIRLRMSAARELIKQKGASGTMIKEIARLSGFTDPYYFSRLFKSKNGMSPSDYFDRCRT